VTGRETLRVGVVGAGAITQLAHLPVLSKMKGVTVEALCDNDGAKARALAERFAVPNTYTDIEDMLDAGELDAVVVATPNHLHEPHVHTSLAAKTHVLCERPLSLTARGVERALTAAQRSGKMIAVANNHRFRSDVQALDLFLRGGELGRLGAVRSGSYQLVSKPEGWRQRRAEAGGGVFLQVGLALLDLALWLTDHPTPVRVSAHMQRARAASSVEDSMFVHLECASGITFVFDLNWSYVGDEDRWWFEVLASRGSARLAPLRVIKELTGKPTDVSPTGASARESAFLQSYRAEWAHFLSVIRGNSGYEPPTDQVGLMKIVEAIYESASEGKELRF
jgi:predicted dehydrogenase